MNVSALLFDVFGTVADWRGSLIREGRALGREKKLDVDWAAFADAWRAGYRPMMDRVRTGKLPWLNIDALHRLILDDLLRQYGIRGLREAEKDLLNRAWHRLKPWPDVIPGLKRLRRHFTVATLSNGNVSLLNDMAKHAGLHWDLVFSAEHFRRYKPDLEVYLGAVRLLGCRPREVMMVAAHQEDLAAARKAGLRTVFVRRPMEFGHDALHNLTTERGFDFTVDNFLELAIRLGCGR